VNVALGDDEEETGLGEEMKYVTEEEEYDLWTERREGQRP
jgi:hypothetical protein